MGAGESTACRFYVGKAQGLWVQAASLAGGISAGDIVIIIKFYDYFLYLSFF
jgi:hypothetical protein